jgi:agmatine deiminase
LDNLELSCYWCNNAKSDELRSDEFKSIGREIGKIMRRRPGGCTTAASDENTNFLYLSGLLKTKYGPFYERLIPVLEKNRIDFGFLPNTKDIWAKDFMPVQVAKGRFIQFRYEPDYLVKDNKHRATISDVTGICGSIEVTAVKSDIVLDGGNLVRFGRKAILTSKIFKENPGYTEKRLIRMLEELLQLDKVIIIPREPGDWLGHADGVVRFLDENTVLINDYSREQTKDYPRELRMSLRNAGLELFEIPYNPYENESQDAAGGVYINYLRMKDFVLVPAFGLPEDEKAASTLSRLFRDSRTHTVRSDEIANEGGVLNCISWNILR